MSRNASVLAVGVLAAGVLLLPAAPASAGQFHGVDVVDDFDCDGVSDAVYPDPFYDVGSAGNAGSVAVYYSGAGVGQIRYTQNTPGVPGTAETGDVFGEAHASTDVNGDGCDELIVGSPGEDDFGGMVTIIEGSPNGLVPTRSTAYTQNTPGVPGTSEDGDWFGTTIVAGTITSGQAYLVVGSPGERLADGSDSGAVYYFRGGVWRTVNMDTPGVVGAPEGGNLGETIAAGDRYIAVGAPNDQVGDRYSAGSVHVFSHRIVGGVPDPIASISQDTAGVSGSPETGDHFGADVSVISYLPSAGAQVGALVAVGVPDEKLGSDTEAGMAHLIAVTPTGKVTELSDVNQDTSGVPDSTERGDQFGYSIALAAGASGTTATPTTTLLAVGVPGETASDGSTGALHVFRNPTAPGTGDVWRPNSNTSSHSYWHIGATSTELLSLDWYGSISERVPWSALIP
ncbi:MAG TPA: FG-GAP repeat protein [Phytomonospora sp.]